MSCTRRSFLASAFLLAASLRAGRAAAALARGLTLDELVARSAHGLVVTPLDAHCAWAPFGKNRVIVTDTRVRIEELLLGAEPESAELAVRVLGGRLGELGERVSGQAELVRGVPSLLFLTRAADARFFVTGAAQGHYPLVADARGERRLLTSPHVPALLKPGTAAVSHLRGRTLPEARELIRAARR
ncbi:MAG TPA: hypothetical protein VGQ57_17620 [Polyangiaceae bacterium]|nr:hypothetical protein [Polyangiaceae bacterium]